MSGITLSFNDIIEEYLDLPIQYIQILFQQGRQWIDPTNKELYDLKKELQQRNIRPIIHISVQIQIINLTSNYLSRAIQEINYGGKLGAEYIVIHCGTRGRHRPIPKEHFKERLNDLISKSRIPILLENSASTNCFGSTLEELKDLTNQSEIGGIVYDTMHHYAAGNDWNDLWNILEDPIVKMIHVNNIPQDVIFKSGQDRHESLDIGKMKDFDQLKQIDKIKILETPNRQKWEDELRLIQTKITDFDIQNYFTDKPIGYKVYTAPTKVGQIKLEAAVDTGAEITCISQKTIEKLKKKGFNVVYVPNPGKIKIKQAASSIGETEWVRIPITISKHTKEVIIPVINGQFRELLIGLDILRGNGKNDGYIINLQKGEMYGNNEVIKLEERKDIYLQEILLQEITRNDVLFQIWKKGKFAQQHIVMEIESLTNKILDLEERYLNESILIPSSSRWSNRPKIQQLKKERNLWENALYELEQKRINKEESERQTREIEKFFQNKQQQIEEQRKQERMREQENQKRKMLEEQNKRYWDNYNPQDSLYEQQLRSRPRVRSRGRSRSRSRKRSPRKVNSKSRRSSLDKKKQRSRSRLRQRSPNRRPRSRSQSRITLKNVMPVETRHQKQQSQIRAEVQRARQRQPSILLPIQYNDNQSRDRFRLTTPQFSDENDTSSYSRRYSSPSSFSDTRPSIQGSRPPSLTPTRQIPPGARSSGIRNRMTELSLSSDRSSQTPPSLYSGPRTSTMGSQRPTPEVYRNHGSDRSSETGSIPSQGLIHTPNRNEIRVYYSLNVKYSYMHSDAVRSLQRNIHETSGLNNLQIRNMNRQFHISKYPDGPFYTTRRKIDELLLDLGGEEPIMLEQVFIVEAPIGMGYFGTYGHTNKWIVIGRNDMLANEIKVDMKLNKELKDSMTKIGEGSVEKTTYPRRKLPLVVTDERLFSNIQNMEKQILSK
jgi:endonuclease IV